MLERDDKGMGVTVLCACGKVHWSSVWERAGQGALGYQLKLLVEHVLGQGHWTVILSEARTRPPG